MATIEQLRIMCQDPAGATELLDDAAYSLAIELESNIYRASAIAARFIAAKLAPLVDMGGGTSSIKLSQKVDHYNSLADAWDIQANSGAVVGSPVATGINVDEINSVRSEQDRYNSTFYRGVLDGD